MGTALRRPRRLRGVGEVVAGGADASSAVHRVALENKHQETANISPGFVFTTDGNSSVLPFDLTTPQAAHILHTYRTTYTPNFPFIPIPEGFDTEQLYQQRPMTFRSIMLVAAPLPMNRVEAIKCEVLGYLGSKLLVEDSRTLDVLQGILICIAWRVFPDHQDVSFANLCRANLNNLCDERVTTLTYMALGLAHTLGITKIPLPTLQRMGRDKKSAEDIRKGGKGDTRRTKPHSLEEQRAYLGLYSILSM